MFRIALFALAGCLAVYLGSNVLHFFYRAYRDRGPGTRKER